MMENQRLYPKWFNRHYYGLTRLRIEITKIINKYLSDENMDLLDFGCGSMPYQSIYKPYVKNYFGADIDLNPDRHFDLDIATSSIKVGSERFDIIVSTQVLEHVVSPQDYLREANRVAKQGGLLIISTHGFFPYHPDPNDYWRWTKSGLHKVLNDNGWVPIETVGIIGYTAAAFSLLQYSVAKRLPKGIRTLFEIVMQRIVSLTDWFYKPEQRQENAMIYLIVCKKK
jgi:SAM-dependent methyltransferase